MKPPERTKEYYEKEFVKKQRSPQDIAEEWHTYPNKIRRELTKYGFTLRNKSEAQSIALKQGRHKHPTKGTKRSDAIKTQISETMASRWKEMSEEERNRRVEISKKQWENMSKIDKLALQDAALEAIRETSKSGSKLEKFLFNNLQEQGYEVCFHTEHILLNTKLQTDLFLPGLKTVIEIDGPSHFFPVWGQETLEKNILADTKKNGLLLSYGFIIIRVKNITKTLSEARKRQLLEKTLEVLKNIEGNFPPLEHRLIEIELEP